MAVGIIQRVLTLSIHVVSAAISRTIFISLLAVVTCICSFCIKCMYETLVVRTVCDDGRSSAFILLVTVRHGTIPYARGVGCDSFMIQLDRTYPG